MQVGSFSVKTALHTQEAFQQLQRSPHALGRQAMAGAVLQLHLRSCSINCLRQVCLDVHDTDASHLDCGGRPLCRQGTAAASDACHALH